MVAVFTGLGAGFERGSASQIGSGGVLGSGAQGRGGDNVSVNAATGNLLISRQDEFLIGRGHDVDISRTYNSLGALDENGDHWRQSTDRRVYGLTGTANTNGSTVKRVGADGSEVTYTYHSTYIGTALNGSNVTGSYRTTDGAGAHDSLVYASGKWAWSTGDSSAREVYSGAGGYIQEQIDQDGNKVTFTYSGTKLTKVTTADGGYLQYVWSGNNITRIDTYSGGTGSSRDHIRTRYTYDGSNRLTKVTTDLNLNSSISDGKVYETSYTYDGASDRVASISQTDGSRVDFTYQLHGGEFKVKTISQLAGNGEPARVTQLDYRSGFTHIIDPSGQATTLSYDAKNRLVEIKLPPGYAGDDFKVTTFTYDTFDNVTSVKDAENNLTTYTYDTRGNVRTVKNPAGDTSYNIYDSRNNLTRVQSLASNAASGNAWQFSRFVYDGEDHLRYSVSAQGRVTEYRYDAAGNLTYEVQYSEHNYGTSSAIPTLAQMDTWRNSKDRTESQLTRHIYDAVGNRVRTIDYGDTRADGSETTANGFTDLRYTYDSAGRLISSKTTADVGSTYSYDGLGRTISTTDINGGTTTIVFNDVATKTVVTSAGGHITTSTYNKAGNLISQATSGSFDAAGTSTNKYDVNGRLRMTTDATGVKTYFVYDNVGNLTAKVDGAGFVQEFRYDDNGRQIASVRYTRYKATADRKAMLATLATNPNNTLEAKDLRREVDQAANHHSYDIWQWTAYDAKGQVSRTVLGDGSVTAYTYDKADRLVKTHSYFNKLSAAQLTNLRNGAKADAYLPSANSSKDQIDRTFYDRDGLVVGTLSGDGYLTENTYDDAGRLIQASVYAGLTSVGLRELGTFNQLNGSISKSSSKDAHTRFVYDGQGHLRFTIDALGKVTEKVYGAGGYAIGLVRSTIEHYATLPSQGGDYSHTKVKAAVAALGSKGSNRTSYAVYNERNQLRYTIDTTGGVARFNYDIQGNLIKTTQFANSRTTSSIPTITDMNSWAGGNTANMRITRSYYTAGNLMRFSVDAEGYVTRYDYDAAGRQTYTFRYTGKVSATDSWTTSTVNGANKGSYVHSYNTYDHQGRLSSVYDANGTRNYRSYYANGALAWEVRAIGQGTEQESRVLHINDAAGRERVTRQYIGSFTDTTDADYRKYRQTYIYYDGLGNVSRVREHPGNHVNGGAQQNTYFEYDKGGNLVKQTDAEGGITLFEHNAFGQVTKTTDPENNITTNSYNNAGQLTRVTDALNYQTDFTYTSFGEQLTVTRDNTTTTFSYDKLGRLSQTKDAYNKTSSQSYDAFGNVVTSTDRRGTVTTNSYDKRGLMSSSITAGIRTNYTHDSRGNALTVTTAVGRAEQATTTYTYDLADRLISTKDALNKTDSYTLDRRGNILEITNKLGNKTTFVYDAIDRVTSQTDAYGNVETFKYDANGNRIESVNKLGGVTYQKYDRLNRLVETRIADSGTYSVESVTTHSYDKNSNLTKTIEALGETEQRTTNLFYDGLNRLIKKTGDSITVYEDGTSGPTTNHVPTETYKYDARNNMIESIDANDGRSLYWYDKLNRLTHQMSAEGTLTRKWYDNSGNETDIRVYSHIYTNSAYSPTGNPPSGSGNVAKYRRTVFTYDGLNRMTQSKVVDVQTASYNGSLTISSTGNDLITDYVYDGNGNVTKVTDPNREVTTSVYDKIGRKIRQYDAAGNRTDWVYDAIGNVTRETRFGHSTGPNRITDYAYDKNGNRILEVRRDVVSFNGSTAAAAIVTGQGGKYNVGGIATSITKERGDSDIEYIYNAQGQVTRKTEATGDYIAYTYDNQGRLVVEKRSGYTDHLGGNVTPQVQYYYNALDDVNRVRKLGKTGSISTSNSYYNYEAGGRLESVEDASGFTRTYRYDAKGQMVREEYVRVTNGVPVTEGIGYDFDKEGRITAQGAVVISGSTWSRGGNELDTINTKYNAFGDVSERGINGKYSELMAYDKAGRLWRTTSGDGAYKYFMHDNNGNQTLVVTSDGDDIDDLEISDILAKWGSHAQIATHDAGGVTAIITKYDARNLAIEVHEPQRETKIGAGLQNLITERSYNAFGEVISETDANNETIDYTYNTMGRRIKIESPEVTVYGEDGTVITDAEYGRGNSGSSTKIRPTEDYYYDISGRLVASRDANGNITQQTLLAGTGYSGTEALITQTIAADGGFVSTAYDIQGNARKITSQLGHNANGIVNETLGYTTNNSYDAMGRLTRVDHANGLESNYGYDGLGQQIVQWDNFRVITTSNGQYVPPTSTSDTATTNYDAQGRVTQSRAFGGDVTNYSYAWNTAASNGLSADGGWIKTTTYAGAANRSSKEFKDVFGKVVKTTDLGGKDTVYTYDNGGRMISASGAGSDTQTYTYLNTGKVGKLVVSGGGYSGNVINASSFTRTSTYGYDKTGNLTSEKLTEVATVTHFSAYGPTSTTTTNKTLQNSTATYDALGRLKTWTESGSSLDRTPPASKAFEYDAQGNIRRTKSTFRTLDNEGVASTTNSVKDHWYLYDSMNRITRSEGTLTGTHILRGQGTDIAYDKAGQRVYSVTDVVTYTGGGGYVPPTPVTTTTRENYTYNTAGQVTQVRETKTTNGNLPTTGGTLRTTLTYDLLGRQTRQLDRNANGTVVVFDSTRVYNAKGQIATDTSITKRSDGSFKTRTTYNYGYGSTYAMGAALTITSTNYKKDSNTSVDSTSKTTNTYGWYQGAVVTATSFDANTSSSKDKIGNTTYQYSQSGVLIGANISDGRSRSVAFTVDNNGQTIRRDESDNKADKGDPHELWYRFGGKEMGYVGNNGTLNKTYDGSITDRTTKPVTGTSAGAFRHGRTTGTSHAEFDNAYEAINSYKQGSGASVHTVRGGETLQSIAQSIYGDSSLWYKIAQANGLSGNTPLIEGQSLALPAGVVKTSHNADTVKPYNPGEVQGDLNPTTPEPPKKSKKGCGVIGQIFLVVVAVAVTVASGGIGAAVAGAVGLSGTAATVAAGAVAAGLGSIASQAVGVATGIQEKFSWKGVAMAAISGGVGAGLGPSANLLEAASKGAAGSAISQGIGVATGLQDSFSWAGVAAAGVAAGVSFAASKALGLSKLDQRTDSPTNGKYIGNSDFDLTKKGNVNFDSVSRHLARGAAGAIASAATRSAIDGSNFGDNILAAIPDVVGQVLGEALYSQCFVAGTLIHTANGVVPIEQITIGNKVLARHDSFISDEVRLRPVVRTFKTEDQETMLLTVQNTDGVFEEIRTTPGHPFARDMREDEVGRYVRPSNTLVDCLLYQRTHIWVSAKSLMIGDRLTDKDGNELEVTGSIQDGELQTVYNFEVSGDHTYFVGKMGTWVHNQSTDAIEEVKTDPVAKKLSPTGQELLDRVKDSQGRLEAFQAGGDDFREDYRNEIAIAEALWEEVREHAFSGSVWDDAAAVATSSFGVVTGFVDGLLTSAWNIAKGVGTALRHPKQTLDGIIGGGKKAIEYGGDVVGGEADIVDDSKLALTGWGAAVSLEQARIYLTEGNFAASHYVTDSTTKLVANVVGPGKLTGIALKSARRGAQVVRLATSGVSKEVNYIAAMVAKRACFAAGTLVHTRNGPVPIEKIQIGDVVWSRSEHDVGENAWKKVIESGQTGEKQIFEVTVASKKGSHLETYRTTELHPFWVENDEEDGAGGFVAAADLEIGDVLKLHDGGVAYVTEVRATETVELVYNLSVDGFKTYHVGELGVWVHNVCLTPTILTDKFGRVTSTSAVIKPENIRGGTGVSSAARAYVKKHGLPGDDAGHLFGKLLGGRGGLNAKNIVPQLSKVNRGKYRQLESFVRDQVLAGNNVAVKITPRYSGVSHRPTAINYQITIGNKTTNYPFGN